MQATEDHHTDASSLAPPATQAWSALAPRLRSLRRAVGTPASQRWQKRHAPPFWQRPLKRNLQGRHWPRPWPAEPTEGRPVREQRRSGEPKLTSPTPPSEERARDQVSTEDPSAFCAIKTLCEEASPSAKMAPASLAGACSSLQIGVRSLEGAPALRSSSQRPDASAEARVLPTDGDFLWQSRTAPLVASGSSSAQRKRCCGIWKSAAAMVPAVSAGGPRN